MLVLSNIYPSPACLPYTAMCVQARASRAATPTPSSRVGPRCITPPPREITTLSDSCSRKVTPPLPAPHRSQPTVFTLHRAHLIISHGHRQTMQQLICLNYVYLISLMKEDNGILERCPCLTLAAYTLILIIRFYFYCASKSLASSGLQDH